MWNEHFFHPKWCHKIVRFENPFLLVSPVQPHPTAATQLRLVEQVGTYTLTAQLTYPAQWRIQGGGHGGHGPPFVPDRQSAAPAGTQEVLATYHTYDAN